jgi:hypothetical protein
LSKLGAVSTLLVASACARAAPDNSSGDLVGDAGPGDAATVDSASADGPASDVASSCGHLDEVCCSGTVCYDGLSCVTSSGVCSTAPEAGFSETGSGNPDAAPWEDGGMQPPPADAGPTCAPGLQLCGSQCLDTSSDPLNCGSCGHSCGAMTCTMGACDSIVLSTEFTPPGRLAIDGTSVYWTNGDGTIRSVPIAGGATSTLAQGLGGGMGVAVDTQNVYAVSQDGRIVSAPISGSMAVTVLATGQPQPYALTIDATNVYWSTVGSGAGNGTIMACAKAGCAQAPTTLASGIHVQYPYGLLVSGGSVYWTSFNFGGEINQVPTTGGAFTTFATGLGYPYEIASAMGTMVAVLYGSGGAIVTVPMTGGSPVNLVGGQAFPTEGTTDGVSAYWTLTIPNAEKGATLVKSSLKAPSPQIMAVNVQPAGSVAVDGTWVYWLTNDGTVRKTAK